MATGHIDFKYGSQYASFKSWYILSSEGQKLKKSDQYWLLSNLRKLLHSLTCAARYATVAVGSFNVTCVESGVILNILRFL